MITEKMADRERSEFIMILCELKFYEMLTTLPTELI